MENECDAVERWSPWLRRGADWKASRRTSTRNALSRRETALASNWFSEIFLRLGFVTSAGLAQLLFRS